MDFVSTHEGYKVDGYKVKGSDVWIDAGESSIPERFNKTCSNYYYIEGDATRLIYGLPYVDNVHQKKAFSDEYYKGDFIFNSFVKYGTSTIGNTPLLGGSTAGTYTLTLENTSDNTDTTSIWLENPNGEKHRVEDYKKKMDEVKIWFFLIGAGGSGSPITNTGGGAGGSVIIPAILSSTIVVSVGKGGSITNGKSSDGGNTSLAVGGAGYAVAYGGKGGSNSTDDGGEGGYGFIHATRVFSSVVKGGAGGSKGANGKIPNLTGNDYLRCDYQQPISSDASLMNVSMGRGVDKYGGGGAGNFRDSKGATYTNDSGDYKPSYQAYNGGGGAGGGLYQNGADGAFAIITS